MIETLPIALPLDWRKSTLDTIEYLTNRSSQTNAVYSTGIQRLDTWVEGGFTPGSLTYIAALPNAGKSALLQTITQGMLDTNSDVILLHYALDDAKPIFIARWTACLGKVSIAAVQQESRQSTDFIRAGVETGRSKFLSMTQRMAVFGASDVESRLDNIDTTMSKIFDEVSTSSGHRPQIVMTIDSPRNLDWTKVPGMAASPTAATEFAGRRLKELLDRYVNGVRVDPIIIATEHLKKIGNYKEFSRPSPDDIKDSIGPQYDANLILLLWNDLAYSSARAHRDSNMWFERPDKRDANAPPGAELPRDPVVELILAKNKMGAMHFGRHSSYMLLKFYQEQSRMDPIVDPFEFGNYAQFMET